MDYIQLALDQLVRVWIPQQVRNDKTVLRRVFLMSFLFMKDISLSLPPRIGAITLSFPRLCQSRGCVIPAIVSFPRLCHSSDCVIPAQAGIQKYLDCGFTAGFNVENSSKWKMEIDETIKNGMKKL